MKTDIKIVRSPIKTYFCPKYSSIDFALRLFLLMITVLIDYCSLPISWVANICLALTYLVNLFFLPWNRFSKYTCAFTCVEVSFFYSSKSESQISNMLEIPHFISDTITHITNANDMVFALYKVYFKKLKKIKHRRTIKGIQETQCTCTQHIHSKYLYEFIIDVQEKQHWSWQCIINLEINSINNYRPLCFTVQSNLSR